MAYNVTDLWQTVQTKLSELNSVPTGRENIKRRKIMTEEILSLLEQPALGDHLFASRELFDQYVSISAELRQYQNTKVTFIQIEAIKYFKMWFQKKGINILDPNISFSPKSGGVQLGTLMRIVYSELGQEHVISYHIKTHQHGSVGTGSSFRSPDPKELFVYKVLEYIGYGPKAHFFYDFMSQGGFYIATQDLAFTKNPLKQKSFDLFSNKIADYNESPALEEHNNAKQGLICLDIISRIFGLTDTTTNPGNFGSVNVAPSQVKWKLLDFRVPDNPDHYFNPNIFHGFQEGNGMFRYEYADFMKNIFLEPINQPARMRTAFDFMESWIFFYR